MLLLDIDTLGNLRLEVSYLNMKNLKHGVRCLRPRLSHWDQEGAGLPPPRAEMGLENACLGGG
jgi:hypothetical protein